MRTLSLFKTRQTFLVFIFSCLMLFASGQSSENLLYVMTPYGGTSYFGTIGTTDLTGGNYTVIHEFNNSNGKYPSGDLLMASDGFFYGTTERGGTSDKGTLFKFDTATNTLTKLHDFNGSNGERPYCSLIEAPNGKLYGTTWGGGTGTFGTLFELDITVTPAVFTKKIDFNSTNGRAPTNSLFLAANGTIYGMTPVGGTNQFGNIFSYDPSTNSLTTLHNFSSTDGRNPYATFLQYNDSVLLAMTAAGGQPVDAGTIFKFNTDDNTFESLHTFNSTDGRTPWGSLTKHSNGKVYGLTRQGGSGDDGIIFEFDPDTKVLTKLHNLGSSGLDGTLSTLYESENGLMLALSERGGTSNAGAIFSYEPGGSPAFTKKQDFNFTNGFLPQFNSFVRAAPGGDDGGGNGGGEECENDTTNVAATTCDPAQVGITVQNFTNAGGCDSLVITTTTLLPTDTTYISATTCNPLQVGVLQQTFTNIFGCDSTVITTTILAPSDTTFVSATTCDPAQVGVTLLSLSNQFGCDSLVITTTTLSPSDTTYVSASTCDPEQIGVTVQVFNNQYGCDSTVITTTTLLPSDTTNLSATTCDPAQVGTAVQIFTNILGCDSVVITTTTLLPSDTTYINLETCDPAEAGVTQQVFTNIFGCDSTVITTTSLETNPPVISVINSPITVWPPNHKYASFDLDDFVISVTDDCDFEVYISHATSDEPENGPGDGNTYNDIVIEDDCLGIKLRKERKGNGNGRVYTIHIVAEDEAGNTTTAEAYVHVPKNNGGTAIDDGPVYQEDGNCSNKQSQPLSTLISESSLDNYPNPFNQLTTLSFKVPEAGTAMLAIYDSRGTLVGEIYNAFAEPGKLYETKYQPATPTKGMYIAVLRLNGVVINIHKMILF